MTRRIFFLNQEAGPLLIDMVNVFAKNGFDVVIYTGQVIKTSTELNESIEVKRLCKYRKKNSFQRVVTWCIFFLPAAYFLVRRLKKDDLLWISTNPPFSPWLNLLFRSQSYIHVYDVYPNALLALPFVSKKSIVYKFFLYCNKKTFKKANRVFVPSGGMKNMLLSSVESEKIEVIPWWADTDFIRPVEKKDNLFLVEHGLWNSFVVMYSGNLGLTHNIEKILDTAYALRDEKNIKIVIIGDGPKKRIVDDFARDYNYDNLLVLPFQDESVLPFSLAAADVSIVLDSFSASGRKESTASIPSKTYYLMAAGSVIYAESDPSSELARLIDLHHLGLCDSSQGIENLVRFIRKCSRDDELMSELRRNSRRASAMFTRDNAARLYVAIAGEDYESRPLK